ncbi:MAG: RagB/SusD family nutrient uptake outer membrane protein, partial [Lachnospiraceae bacterium]|nr:RagB/SusD family nutrient uptake outer membrane protein [Lachnospiraceae bacterium]
MAQIKLYLHKKDGSIIEYIAAEIDSITLSLYDVPGNPENPEVPPVVPSDSVVVEKISFDSLTTGMYYQMWYVDRDSYWGLQELTSDEIVVPTRFLGDWRDGYMYLHLHNHDFEVASRRTNNTWMFLVEGINMCDRLIGKINNDEVEDCTEENLAELYIYRSWYQYLMLDSFGDIQYNGKELSRTEAFDSIITDLLTYVPKASIEKDYGRVNRSVGWMILSKMYLNAEAWNVAGIANFAKSAQDCYRISAAFADSIIIKGGYSLESDYFTNFKVDNQISKENIWNILCEESYGDGLEFHNLTHHYALKDKYGMKEQPWNGYCTTHKVIGIYEAGDRRIETWARGQQYDKEDSVIKISVGIDESAYMKMPIYVRKPNSWPYNLEAFKLMNAGLYSINFDFPVYYTDT